jgi:hypothetical protein
MAIRLMFAAFALALPLGASASYSGPCGGDWTDADGNKGSCGCADRPQCDDEGECWCEFDQYCADTACGSVAAVEHQAADVAISAVRVWKPVDSR